MGYFVFFFTVRMQMRRFTRLTNGFSKSLEHHKAALAIHFVHYNFCRIHQSIRITPARAAGLTDHVWELTELIGLLRERAQLGNDGVRGLVRVAWRPFAALATFGPATQLAVPGAGAGLAFTFDGADKSADVNFILTMRTFHAANIPNSLPCLNNKFKVAHYPK